MKRIALLSLIMFGLTFGSHAQKLSKDEVAGYENEIKTMLNYLEETLNFLGDSTATALEKQIVFTESWNKIFIDEKVQVEDDLDINRKTPINKDVQAYLKDIDFFFKQASFKFDVQSIANSTRNDGSIFFKVTMTRHLKAKTIADETVDNIANRFVEVNLDRQNSNLKIASIYTTKINEKEALRNWWNSLSQNWKTRLGSDVLLYDSIPLSVVSAITNADFTAYEKLFKTEANMRELDKKLKSVTQKQNVDISGIREIITVEPLSELSDLVKLDISGTSIDDITPVRNLNKLKVLRANSSLIDDISSLKYCITLEELEIDNTNVSDLLVLTSLRNLKKLNVANTMVSRINYLKNCSNLTNLNLGGCNIGNLTGIQDLQQLTNLDISNTVIRDIAPVGELKQLQSINLSGSAVSNLQPLSQLENLREVYCSNTIVKDLSPLKNNKKLSRIYCDKSKVGDAEASAFTNENRFTLIIYDTEALKKWWEELPIYWKAVFSKQIELNEEPTTEELHQIINLQQLELADDTYIQSLMPVSRLTNLKSLGISNTEITNLFAIQNLTNLETLDISYTYINSIEPLKEMKNLKRLNITGTPVKDLTPLINDDYIEVIIADETSIDMEKVVELKELQRQVTVIYQTEHLQEWWNELDDTWKEVFRNHVALNDFETPNALELQKIVDLRELDITTEFPVSSLIPIRDFIWIERLTINNQNVRDLYPMGQKTYLRELNIQNNPITSLDPIENSTMLELLNIENTQIDDLGPLSKMNELITLNASGTPIKSLKPLSGLMKLQNLYVNNTNVKSLSPIENINTLKQLKVYNTKVKSRSIEQLQQKRLDLNIMYY